MRRCLSRLLRLRNLLILTLIVILLHLLKSLSQIELKEADNNLEHDSYMLPQSQEAYDKMEHFKYFVPATLIELRDWHNYTQISMEKKRVGLGEQGRPASLPASEAKLEEKLYSVNGFNGALSDRILLNRSIPDIRHSGCRNMRYLSSLPTVSVVVPFHNEHWSTLLRTAYSVMYRAPEHLIKEVLLVDDASTKDFLKSKLDAFLSANMPKSRVIRLPRRSGLITARLAGAKEATGDVLLFLDSHTEANVNFLPPLLDPIAKNYRTVVCPFIDVIAYDTFEYRAQDEGARGAFDWELFYKRLPVLPKDQANMPEPFDYAELVLSQGVACYVRPFIPTDPIARSRHTVVCPFIDDIAYDTFEYRAQDEGARGSFDWELFYKRLPVLPKDELSMPEPFQSPVMAGGLFAISRAYFWELGGYDPGLDIWGGEQYELSFKIWQCGGRMIDAPCSRIGHIYRKFAPFPNPNRGDFVGKNYRRVAEVWMDEYKEHLYRRRPHYRGIDPGDLSEQRALRQRLRCKSFHWFITQIAFDLPFKYPPVEPEPFAQGRIRSMNNPDLCIDAHDGRDKDALTLTKCTASGAENKFIFSWHKDIRTKKRAMCWDLPDGAPKSKILLYSCHLGGGNQLWRYHVKTNELRQGKSKNCVEYDPNSHALYINHCSGSVHQKWDIDNINHKQMDSWDSIREVVYAPIEKVLEGYSLRGRSGSMTARSSTRYVNDRLLTHRVVGL